MTNDTIDIPDGDLINYRLQVGGNVWTIDLFRKTDGETFWYIGLPGIWGGVDCGIEATREQAEVAIRNAMMRLRNKPHAANGYYESSRR